MRVSSLVGKSGTGKSYQAMDLAREKGIDLIIDDGLLIYKNNVVCGTSAKREPTKVGAIKAALFTKDIRRAEAVRKLNELEPESVIVLATSEKMANQIVERLDLPPIEEIIRIEDITTEDQREVAQKQRNVQGKHVVPVPAAQLKRQFSGYFMNPLRIFRGWEKGKNSGDERAVVRPTYSYLGNYYISEKVIADIVAHIIKDQDDVIELKKVIAEKRDEELRVRINCIFSRGCSIPKTAIELQRTCLREIEKITAFNIDKINIDVRDIG